MNGGSPNQNFNNGGGQPGGQPGGGWQPGGGGGGPNTDPNPYVGLTSRQITKKLHALKVTIEWKIKYCMEHQGTTDQAEIDKIQSYRNTLPSNIETYKQANNVSLNDRFFDRLNNSTKWEDQVNNL